MKRYAIVIEPRAFNDIQDAIFYYNALVVGLGEKFYNELDKCFESLEVSPFFQFRYKDIRCLPLKKFPYMIHFTVDETKNTVYVHAIINCYQNPDTKWLVNEP